MSKLWISFAWDEWSRRPRRDRLPEALRTRLPRRLIKTITVEDGVWQSTEPTEAGFLRSTSLGRLVAYKPWDVIRSMDPVGKEGIGRTLTVLCRSGGGGALLRVDRRSEQRKQRDELAPEVHAAAQAQHLVQDQSRKSRTAD